MATNVQFYRPSTFKNLAVSVQDLVSADMPGSTSEGRIISVDYLDLYHRTTGNAAAGIYAEKRMRSRENTAETYWSNRPDGQATGYGPAIVHIRVPEHLAELEDEFPDGELHYRVPARALRPEHFIPAVSALPRTTGTSPAAGQDPGPTVGL